MLQRLATLVALDLLQHVGDERVRIGGRRIVRRHDDVRVRPKRAVLRQRFGRKDIEAGAGERALIERGENIGLDLQAAASGIDQSGAACGAVTRCS